MTRMTFEIQIFRTIKKYIPSFLYLHVSLKNFIAEEKFYMKKLKDTLVNVHCISNLSLIKLKN